MSYDICPHDGTMCGMGHWHCAIHGCANEKTDSKPIDWDAIREATKNDPYCVHTQQKPKSPLPKLKLGSYHTR